MQKSFSVPPLAVTIITSAVTAVVMFLVLTVAQPQIRPEILSFLRFVEPRNTSTALGIPETIPPANVLSEDEAVIQLVKNAQPAVVAVLVLSNETQPQIRDEVFPFDGGLNPFLQAPAPTQKNQGPSQIGGGSGFFVSEDGLVATNKHVTDFPNAIFQVVTSDGKKYSAKVLATDPVLDIAFLKVDNGRFPYLHFGDSDALKPGQTVVAIGNALDEFRNTVTKGVISGLNRRVFAGDGASTELIEEAIQTDAAINPGNSGGPLLDLHGNVVGLNTAISEQGQSLGFALPSNVVNRDVASVRTSGKVVRPFLGVRYQMIDEEIIKQNHLNVDHGALVIRGAQRSELAVSPGSPADKAGIVENDIILSLDNEPITLDHSLSSLIGRHAPGDTVTLNVLHAGTEKTITLQLAELK